MGNWGGSIYDRTFERLCNEGFRNNILVHRCMWLIATNCMKFPLLVVNSKGETVPNSPALNPINNPSPQQSGFIHGVLKWYSLYLAGSSYEYKLRSASGKVVGLQLLQPNYLLQYVPPTAEQALQGYIIGAYRFTMRDSMGNATVIDIPASDIIHTRLPDPLNPAGGISPLAAAYASLRTDNEASEYIYWTFKNRGKNPSIIMRTINQLNDSVIAKIKASWETAFSGEKRGGVGAMPPEVSAIEQLSMTMKDLEFPELRGMDESRICMAFGVPPILVGAKIGMETTADTNVEQQQLLFYENTIEPNLAFAASSYNSSLMPEFDRFLKYEYDLTKSPTMMKIAQLQTKTKTDQVLGGLITLNEWRTATGYKEDPKGDYYLRPGNKAVVLFGTTEPIKQLEPPPAKTDTARSRGCTCGKTHKRTVKRSFTDKEYARRLRIAGARLSMAMDWISQVRSWADGELKSEYSDILYIVDKQATKKRSQRAYTDAPDIDEQIAMIQDLEGQKPVWQGRIISTVSTGWMRDLFEQAGISALKELGVEGIAIDIEFSMVNPATVEYVQGYSYQFAQKISQSTADQVRTLFGRVTTEGMSYDTIKSELHSIYEGWSSSRLDMIAHTESLRAANAGALEGYRQAGAVKKEWNAALGDACPDCEALDGTVVGIEDYFVGVGEQLPETGTVNTYEPIEYGNAHPNCRCTIVPVFDFDEEK